MFDRDLRSLPWGLAALCYADGEGDVPESATSPALEAPATSVVDPGEVQAAPEGDAPAEPALEAPKPQKSPVAQLQGRVGYLTKQLHERDAELARLRDTAPAPVVTAPAEGAAPQTFSQDEIDRLANIRAGEIARAGDFNRRADATYDAGKAAYPDFDEKLKLLGDLGVIDRTNLTVLEAAMATGEGHTVLHALGEDPEAAMRVASLPPIQMAAEMTRMAQRLSAATPPAQVSAAPPPIRPLGGVAQPEPDIYNPDLYKGESVPDDYIALRAKQSSAPWYARYRH